VKKPIRTLTLSMAICFALIVPLVGVPSSAQDAPERDSIVLAKKPDKPLYLTFDDGPSWEFTAPMLALLDEYDAKATFFQIGYEARDHPYLVRRIARQGHALGNHSWSHPDLTTLTPEEIRLELLRTVVAQQGLAGPCMRPPNGAIDDKVEAVVKEMGLTPVMATGNAGDWLIRPVAEIMADMKEATRPGAILLLHDGVGPRENTLVAVARLLPWWKQQGYDLLPVPECVRVKDIPE
jgi:peptidoglycan/xylan/chitin deacetylase (PgdA/CDA1 family)